VGPSLDHKLERIIWHTDSN